MLHVLMFSIVSVWAAKDPDASQPLLPLASAPDPSSNPPKGSPGENAMRGVRKLSICNSDRFKSGQVVSWEVYPQNT